MADLDTYIVTFNCGRKQIDTDFFSSHLFDQLRDTPDLIVLCLQEIAPIAYSFLSTSMITRYTGRFETAVHNALRQSFGDDVAEQFMLTELRNIGMTAVMVFARNSARARISRVDIAGVGVGLWEMGNKGAVGVRLWIEEEDTNVPVTFIAAHLAPSEDAWERRNQDWQSICERLVFSSDVISKDSSIENQPLLGRNNANSSTQEQSIFEPFSALFFAGDLNYRTSDSKPHPDDHKEWPTPHDKDFESMLKQDQLTRERVAKRTLNLMDEADIDFPPSYKYSEYAQREATRLVKKPTSDDKLWAEHRMPSWCDRILFLAGSQPKAHFYTTLPIQPTSDHRPVSLSVTIPLKTVTSSAALPYKIDSQWKARRAAARRLEVLVGIAAYLTLTREGNAILLASVIGVIGSILAVKSVEGR